MFNGRKRKETLPPLIVVGLKIQRARKKRRMSVERLAKKSRISSRYINEIECGNFTAIPGKAYVLGFTRTLSKELGLDDSEIVEIVKSEVYGNSRIDSKMDVPCSVRVRSIGSMLARVLRLSPGPKPTRILYDLPLDAERARERTLRDFL
jgi:transcriptional regulator with XRE-family HTH domain